MILVRSSDLARIFERVMCHTNRRAASAIVLIIFVLVLCSSISVPVMGALEVNHYGEVVYTSEQNTFLRTTASGNAGDGAREGSGGSSKESLEIEAGTSARKISGGKLAKSPVAGSKSESEFFEGLPNADLCVFTLSVVALFMLISRYA